VSAVTPGGVGGVWCWLHVNGWQQQQRQQGQQGQQEQQQAEGTSSRAHPF